MSSSSSMSAVSMIHTKRWDDRPHTDEELKWWIESYTSGEIPDYQMSAWLMAVCWRGMTMEETASLTKYMVQSGKVLTWPMESTRVDKHSTGGVGDKVSLVLAPLVAACSDRVQVPMMAGRGLDHTGGTLDKLESIPGYKTSLSTEEFQHVVRTVGCSIVSAGQDMALADRKLYALRDVTGTVSSIPLQTASIMSKKIAEGPDTLVLDTKYGKGAFQQSVEDAHALAKSMVVTGQANGVQPTTAFLTRMDHPIGYSIGNWLEIKECVDLMKSGTGAQDLIQLVVVQSAQLLLQSERFPDSTFQDLINLTYNTLKEGKAYIKFRDMVQAHGGDIGVLENPENYPNATLSSNIVATQDGYIADMNALVWGRATVDLGAGRRVADEAVDATAGIWIHKTVGDAVTKGESVATIYTNHENCLEEIGIRLQNSILYSSDPVVVPSVVTHLVTSSGIEEFTMPSLLR